MSKQDHEDLLQPQYKPAFRRWADPVNGATPCEVDTPPGFKPEFQRPPIGWDKVREAPGSDAEVIAVDEGAAVQTMAEHVATQDHYSRFAIEPMEFIVANNLGYREGNIVKYVCRHPYKGQQQGAAAERPLQSPRLPGSHHPGR
jgi:hypothetical protein